MAQDLLGDTFAAPVSEDEEFRYLNVGADIVIVGGRQRVTMYGVYSFLEREFGCRWYATNATSIPKRDTFQFEYLAHTEKPGIRVRTLDMLEAFDPVWAARNRVNGASASGTNLSFGTGIRAVRKQIGGLNTFWEVHTFDKVMPSSGFFESHPEYYSLIDGERRGGSQTSQRCLTNPDVLRIFTERILDVIREQPQHLIYDVSQNDGDDALPCQCEACQAIAKREESEAGPIIWFVNQVAEAVEKEFPGKLIGTLAYDYSETPPKNIRPRENVVIRLAGFYNCFSHPLDGCPMNQRFDERIKGWAPIAPHLADDASRLMCLEIRSVSGHA